MPIAASPSQTSLPFLAAWRARHGKRIFAAWQFLPATFALLIGFLALTPDGMAEPLQAVASWMLVGLVAVLAVIAVAKGLERLIACDGG